MATANPFCFERAEVKISRKFVISPDILVAKGKKFGHKCDCIGCNFEPCSCYLLNTTCSSKEVFNIVGNVFSQIWFSELSSFTAEKNNDTFFSRWLFVFCELMICLKNCFCFCLLTSLYFNFYYWKGNHHYCCPF